MLKALELSPTADGTAPPDWEALLDLPADLLFLSEPPGTDNGAALEALRRRAHAPLVPHLTTRNRTAQDIARRVGEWRGRGIDRLLALRGDAVGTCDLARDPRLRSAAELTRLLVALDPDLEVWVAGHPEGHPEAVSAEADLHALVAKVEAGATGIVCQVCFDADALLRFRDRCHAAGIAVPLLAGLMPLDDAPRVRRFAADNGVSLPGEVEALLGRHAGDAAALHAAGATLLGALATRLAREEWDGCLVFSRNSAAATLPLWAALPDTD